MTDEELLSLLAFGRPGFTLPLPQAFDQGDQQHMLGLYRSILAGAAEPDVHGPLRFGDGGVYVAGGISGGVYVSGGSLGGVL